MGVDTHLRAASAPGFRPSALTAETLAPTYLIVRTKSRWPCERAQAHKSAEGTRDSGSGLQHECVCRPRKGEQGRQADIMRSHAAARGGTIIQQGLGSWV